MTEIKSPPLHEPSEKVWEKMSEQERHQHTLNSLNGMMIPEPNGKYRFIYGSWAIEMMDKFVAEMEEKYK